MNYPPPFNPYFYNQGGGGPGPNGTFDYPQPPPPSSFPPAPPPHTSFPPPNPRAIQERDDLIHVASLPRAFQPVFSSFRYFNAVQSACFSALYEGLEGEGEGGAAVVSAPTGAGKTVLFELAFLRLLKPCLAPDGTLASPPGGAFLGSLSISSNPLYRAPPPSSSSILFSPTFSFQSILFPAPCFLDPKKLLEKPLVPFKISTSSPPHLPSPLLPPRPPQGRLRLPHPLPCPRTGRRLEQTPRLPRREARGGHGGYARARGPHPAGRGGLDLHDARKAGRPLEEKPEPRRDAVR